MNIHRRDLFRLGALGLFSGRAFGDDTTRLIPKSLRIKGLKITPIALPDPPILAASGCHGPYFLRNVVEIDTEAGIVGLGETVGGQGVTDALEKARALVIGRDAFAYRAFGPELRALGEGCYAGIELACLDALGKASGRRVCELLGGPVREEDAPVVEPHGAEPRVVVRRDPRLAHDHPDVRGARQAGLPRRVAGSQVIFGVR